MGVRRVTAGADNGNADCYVAAIAATALRKTIKSMSAIERDEISAVAAFLLSRVMAPPAGCSFWVVHPAEESTTVEMWELVAREHIRDTLARYNWSGDAGRLDDLADTFCADGVLEIRGLEPLRGRSEIVAFLGGVTGSITVSADVKPIVRHNVANVLFNEVTMRRCRATSPSSPISASTTSAATAIPWYPTVTPG
jgi:SnoaL-like domain